MDTLGHELHLQKRIALWDLIQFRINPVTFRPHYCATATYITFKTRLLIVNVLSRYWSSTNGMSSGHNQFPIILRILSMFLELLCDQLLRYRHLVDQFTPDLSRLKMNSGFVITTPPCFRAMLNVVGRSCRCYREPMQ